LSTVSDSEGGSTTTQTQASKQPTLPLVGRDQEGEVNRLPPRIQSPQSTVPSVDEDDFFIKDLTDLVGAERVIIPTILLRLNRPGQGAPIPFRNIKEAIEKYDDLVLRFRTSPLCHEHIQALTLLRDVAIALEVVMLDNSSVNKSTLLSSILPETFPCDMLHSFECDWILSFQPGFNTMSDILGFNVYVAQENLRSRTNHSLNPMEFMIAVLISGSIYPRYDPSMSTHVTSHSVVSYMDSDYRTSYKLIAHFIVLAMSGGATLTPTSP